VPEGRKAEAMSCVCVHILMMMQAAIRLHASHKRRKLAISTEIGPGMLAKRQDTKACHYTVL